MRANKGAAGIDGLDIDQTAERLPTEWPANREQLLSGAYRPQPVRPVTILKPDGGERELGIPTVTDRLIQQAPLQVLQPMLDPLFSQHSYAFRPGLSAHQAMTFLSRHQAARLVVLPCHGVLKRYRKENMAELSGVVRVPEQVVVRVDAQHCGQESLFLVVAIPSNVVIYNVVSPQLRKVEDFVVLRRLKQRPSAWEGCDSI